MRTADELVAIIAAGASVTINATRYAVDDIVRMTAEARGRGGRVTLTNAAGLSTEDLKRIASHGAGGAVALIDP